MSLIRIEKKIIEMHSYCHQIKKDHLNGLKVLMVR